MEIAQFRVEPLSFRYRNHRGEVADRLVVPGRVEFGKTEFHPEPQWLMHAFDLLKGGERTFAMKDMLGPALAPGPDAAP